MITVVFVNPPVEGIPLRRLHDKTGLTASECVSLYRATVKDVCQSVDMSGADLLVNYRDESTLNSEQLKLLGDTSAIEAVQSIFDLDFTFSEEPRFERQVGSSHVARIGNTVSHLLTTEDASSVAILHPTVPLIGRTVIDSAAMSLRRNDVIVSPTPTGSSYLTCFNTEFDFSGIDMDQAITSVTERAIEQELRVGFSPMLPTIDTATGLRITQSVLWAWRAAGKQAGQHTAAVFDDINV